jgi:hypothetical protein
MASGNHVVVISAVAGASVTCYRSVTGSLNGRGCRCCNRCGSEAAHGREALVVCRRCPRPGWKLLVRPCIIRYAFSCRRLGTDPAPTSPPPPASQGALHAVLLLASPGPVGHAKIFAHLGAGYEVDHRVGPGYGHGHLCLTVRLSPSLADHDRVLICSACAWQRH